MIIPVIYFIHELIQIIIFKKLKILIKSISNYLFHQIHFIFQ